MMMVSYTDGVLMIVTTVSRRGRLLRQPPAKRAQRLHRLAGDLRIVDRDSILLLDGDGQLQRVQRIQTDAPRPEQRRRFPDFLGFDFEDAIFHHQLFQFIQRDFSHGLTPITVFIRSFRGQKQSRTFAGQTPHGSKILRRSRRANSAAAIVFQAADATNASP